MDTSGWWSVMTTGSGSTWFSWTSAIVGSFIVGLSGLVPLLLIPKDQNKDQNKTQDQTSTSKTSESHNNKKTLNRHLSFAVGGLLGDVFLHLVPEAYGSAASESDQMRVGLWLIFGVLVFLLIEKVFEATEAHDENENKTGNAGGKKIIGYLNLLANCIDNFIHGLAVASSFLSGLKLGLTTAFAILVHEIPHEVGDFAILLNSGFSRFEAAKAQFTTAAIGMLGACFALWMDCIEAEEANTLWVLPFSAGGFLNIALVSVLPDILKETDPKESLIQLGCMLLGIAAMSALCMF